MRSFKSFFCVQLLTFIISGCNNSLLPSPTTTVFSSEENNSIYQDYPVNVSASQGLKRKIHITWSSVNRAVRYDIFSAETPYSPFIQIGETNEETFFDYICEPGTSRYFKIQAVNAKNNAGIFSDTVFGTSLSEPYITLIENEKGSNDGAVSVYWWMNDESALTYIDKLIYTVTCKDESGNIISQKNLKHTELTETKTTFTSLKPLSQYFFSVDAFLLSAQDDIESSYNVDVLTARKLFPNPPENLCATQGTNTDNVELTFTLPDFVDVAAGKGIYEQKPLYFNIYRKNYESDDDWELIETNVKPLEYIPEESYTYTDNNTKRGSRYEYKVQSFADTTKLISSDYSASFTAGYPMTVPVFSILETNPVLNDEGTFYKSDSVRFSFRWETFGTEELYNFILSEKRKDLEDDIALYGETEHQPVQKIFSTIDELNSYKRIFTLPEDHGYYTYNLKIVMAANNTEEATSVSASRRILITEDTSKPEIKNFTSADGYSDKFILSFEYDDTCSYELKYVNAHHQGTEWLCDDFETDAVSVDISEYIVDAITGDTITITENVESGDSRKYMLSAIRGVSVEEQTDILQTLGTASLQAQKIEHSYFSIKWEPVQKAEKYVVYYSYAYDDIAVENEIALIHQNGFDYNLNYPDLGETQIDVADLSTTAENGWQLLSDGSITFSVINPLGHQDPRISGRPFCFTVKAINAIDETNACLKNIRLLGPQTTTYTATQAQYHNKILLSWNKVEGAAGYSVIRQRCNIQNNEILSTDEYSVFPETNTIKLAGEMLAENYVTVTNGNIITLTDFYTEKPETGSSSYQDNQDKIPWGFPYRYTVIPITDENDRIGESLYGSFADVCTTGSALGYGHNVTATKSESASKIFVTSTKPFMPDNVNPTPVLWYSEYNQNNWQKSEITADAQGRFVFTPDKNDRTKAFIFAVKYFADNICPSQNYLNQLALTATDDEFGEPSNKGYIFAINSRIETITENDRPTYSEKISWENWDYSVRARGPRENSAFTIQIKNYNLQDSWYNIASQSADGSINSTAEPSYKINVSCGVNSVTLTPTDIKSDTDIHTGLLEVLRDYRHFGKILFVRDTENGEIEGSWSSDQNNFWTDRKITNAEYAKAAMLSLTYPFYISCGGKTDYSNITECYVKTEKTVTDGEGSFYISGGSIVTDISEIFVYGGKYNHTCSFTSYAPLQLMPSGKSARFLRLSCANGKLMRKGLNEGFYKFKEELELSVSLYSDSENPEYSGTVKVNCDENWNLSIMVSRSGYPVYSKTCSSKNEVHEFFPMRFASDSTWYFTSNGWWH